MNSPKAIFVMGPDRAGTTHFCSLFEGVDGVLTSKAYPLYEVLKHKGDLCYEEKARELDQFIDAAQKQEKCALLKIIYHQMTPEQLGTYFKAHSNILKIVMTRNVVDMYISHRKARKVKAWRSQDTSNIRIWFNYKFRFDRWARKRIDYMIKLKAVFDAMAEKPVVIDYEDLHRNEGDADKLFYACARIREHYGFELKPSASVESTVCKQDKNTNFSSKVYNIWSLRRKIKDRSLELRDIFEDIAFKF